MTNNNNEKKRQVLEHMDELMKAFTDKLKILEALDDDETCSGCKDLNDQIDTFWQHQTKLKQALARGKDVIPTSDDLAKLFGDRPER